MTALSQDMAAEFKARIAELERQLQSDAADNSRLQHELSLSRERQRASAEILGAIADTTGDDERALRQIAEITARLFGASSVTLRVTGGDPWSRTIAVGPGAERIVSQVNSSQLKIGGKNFPGTVVAENRQIHLPDIFNVGQPYADFPGLQHGRAAGARVMAGTPLRREGKAIGALILQRDRPEPFSADELALLQSFADQAVIAIENARLFNETKEALERQTATADILRVISQSPTDARPVFEAIAQRAKTLVGGFSSTVFRFADGQAHLEAFTPTTAEADEFLKSTFPRPVTDFAPFELAQSGEVTQIPDIEGLGNEIKDIGRARGFRSMLFAPLMNKGASIGFIAVTRVQTGTFVEQHVELLRTFADQAVIAIENARLFSEVQARTRDLTEALQQQTATADVLKVISRSAFDLQTVFDALLTSACRLCGADIGTIRYEDGGSYRLAATYGCRPEWIDHFRTYTSSADRSSIFGRTILDGRAIHVPDVLADPDYRRPAAQKLMGFRAALGVPLVREGHTFGVINLFRFAVGSFQENQIDLVATFADQAVIAIENVRLFEQVQARTRDLTEALQQQTATADVLKVISRSAFDLQTVLETLIRSAVELSAARRGAIFLRDGDEFKYQAASYADLHPDWVRFLQDNPQKAGRHSAIARAIASGQVVCVPDVLADPEITMPATALAGIRAVLAVPLLRDGKVEGIMALSRQVPGPFTERQIELVQTFADQAVIALENVRLFDEVQSKTRDLTEALQQQTATADVLKVISRSAFDLDSVMNTLTHSAAELCKAELNALYLREGDLLVVRGVADADPAQADFLRRTPVRADSSTYIGRTLLAGAIRNIADVDDEREIGVLKRFSEALDFKSILFVPLMREGRGIGVFALARKRTGQFSQREVDLVQTFADQAVIAIENSRLFEEVQERTRDLQESLQQQTATAEVLQVISRSPGELQPVFEAVLENATRICDARFGTLLRFDGNSFYFAADIGTPETLAEYVRRPGPFQGLAGGMIDRIQKTRQVQHSPDYAADTAPGLAAKLGGARSTLGVPILRDDVLVGAIVIYRQEVRPFTEREIELVRSFAAQAAIAIENARLFNDTQEALEQQTATSEVLSVISRSAGDLAPVFDAMLSKAMELCGANFGVLNTYDGTQFQPAATYGLPPAYAEYRRRQPLDYGPTTAPTRLLNGEAFVEIADLRESDAYLSGEPNRRALVDLGGAHCLLTVPLLKDERVVGNVMIFRQENLRFSEKQITLLQQFAAQAVIAIENTRLLSELRHRTDDLSEALEQQTATSDVLQVISNSSGDLQPVFDAMLANATRICEAKFGMMWLIEGDAARCVALHNAPPAFAELRQREPVIRPGPDTAMGRLLRTRQVVHVEDAMAERAYVEGDPVRRANADLAGARTIVAVPLLRDNEVIGAIGIFHQEVRPFTDKQIQLVTNFANQAVIAIENARLLNELRHRTAELSRSLDELRTAQDRLVQTEKLASLGQLTAGIAHEIKNPLNFVNNFAALSAELTDELNEALAQASLADATRTDVDELTGMLKDNLQKIVQHGKRADSIVKNMLLHSREGSGEHRPTDVNALVEESLNLAYHGARAEKPQFNVTLARELDPAAGTAELFPQEITRVLLNLISNGFYAVTKRGADNGGGFEPILSAVTRDRGAHVEIRIRDNGTGIPPEVKERMFNPFFTTKPAGEGTGLGLSMSHDIIVKQHGGTIEVDTAPGEFTEFTILLPRKSNFSGKSRG